MPTINPKLKEKKLLLEKEVSTIKTEVKHLNNLLLKIKSFGEKAKDEDELKEVEKILDDA